jgi:uncharacterized protein YndB with AHSA1/START domain
MTEPSVTHATFVIERTYDASPARVFAAWADPAAKRRWFGGPEDPGTTYELDFRVGGQEIMRDPSFSYVARYENIVPNRRIVFTYDMEIDKAPISVSLATVELKVAGAGTRLVYTEQGAFLDGLDTAAQREHGTAEMLDLLGTVLQQDAS